MLAYNPFARDSLAHALLLDDVFGPPLFAPPRRRRRTCAAAGALDARAVSVTEAGDAYVVSASLPGVKAADIQIELERNVLSLRAERKAGDRRLTCHRQLTLPSDADAAGARATHEDGLLTITVPKAEEKRIAVGPPADAAAPPDDAYVLSIAAPGVRAADLHLGLSKDGVLTARGETTSALRSSRLARTVKLPAGLDADAATATHEDGLLTVVVPKAAEAAEPAVRIPVTAADGAANDGAADGAGGGDGMDEDKDDEFEAVEA